MCMLNNLFGDTRDSYESQYVSSEPNVSFFRVYSEDGLSSLLLEAVIIYHSQLPVLPAASFTPPPPEIFAGTHFC
jgi:hypothetical protein